MNRIITSRTFHLILCIVFSVIGLLWIFISNPHFPTSSLYTIELPFRLPIIGLIIPCWLLYFNLKNISLAWLILVVPIFIGFNIHMIRPDLYFLWLCLLSISLCRTKEQIFMCILFILGGMYIWTAIQKTHIDFVTSMSGVFDKRLFQNLNIPVNTSKYLAISIPIVEFFLGALCFTKLLKVRRTFAIFLHGGIIFFLVKGGWNSTMISWNICLMLLHIILPVFAWQRLELRAWSIPFVAVIFPTFYFIGIGPAFASWTMYSGRIKHYRLKIDEQIALYPPEYIREFIYEKEGEYSVSITSWADEEIGGAPCMEPIFADKIMRDCDDYMKSHP